jgi:hypothetical protein
MRRLLPPQPSVRRSAWRGALTALLLAVVGPSPSTLHAQAPREPRLAYVFPAGGRTGATLVVRLGGQFLEGATNLWVSGGGVEATILDYNRPLTPREFNQLRAELEKLSEKRRAALNPDAAATNAASTNLPPARWTPEDARRLAELRRQLTNAPNRQANPALAETVFARITLAPDAAPGPRELRLRTAAGLTAPLPFHVGTLPEHLESASRPDAAPDPSLLELPAVVNGRILPGETDRYRFTARRGQRLVLAAQARALIPFLADAVPGWFQAVLTVRDAGGAEVAYCDDYRLQPDPVILFEAPADGAYTVEIRDALFRGREDFVYRLALGELPFVTGVWPPGGPADQPCTVHLSGWNLGATNLTVCFPRPGIHRLEPPGGNRWLNEVRFAADALPETADAEPNDSPAAPQVLAGPVIVNGRVNRPADADFFALTARAGEVLVAEVFARRLGSPLDARLTLSDPDGRVLAANDDHADPGAGLDTHHADPYLRVTIPAAGRYLLRLEDTQGKGGAEFTYRLRVGPPRPDFELRVAPSTLNARAGATVPLTVWALRRDGYDGDIQLDLVEPPPGFRLSGGWAPAGQEKVRVTLTVPPEASPEPVALRLEGRARLAGRDVVRAVVPADERTQAFFYQHWVPAQELLVTVLDQGRPAPRLRLLSEVPVRIPAGGSAKVTLGAPFPRWAAQFQLALEDPPAGLELVGTRPGRSGMEVEFRADAERLKPGLKGNLLLTAQAGRAAGTTNRPAAAPARRAPGMVLPAIPFEVVPAAPARAGVDTAPGAR